MKRLFFAVAWLPHRLYCQLYWIGAFLRSLPEEMRENRRYSIAPKQVTFCRLSDKRVKLDEAVELINKRRQRDGQKEREERWPAWIARLRNLVRESRSPFWRFGSLEEFMVIPTEKLIVDVAQSSLALLPKEEIFIWAIHTRSHTFVAYNLFTGVMYRGMPEDVPFSSFSGDPPKPTDEHYVYAVSVRIKEEGGT
jgi:hypothetical protein